MHKIEDLDFIDIREHIYHFLDRVQTEGKTWTRRQWVQILHSNSQWHRRYALAHMPVTMLVEIAKRSTSLRNLAAYRATRCGIEVPSEWVDRMIQVVMFARNTEYHLSPTLYQGLSLEQLVAIRERLPRIFNRHDIIYHTLQIDKVIENRGLIGLLGE